MKKQRIHYYLFTAIMIFLFPLMLSLVSIYLLPSGINRAFVESLWKRLFIPIPPLVAALGIFLFFFQNKEFSYTKQFESLEKQDWLFLLIPMFPIVQYLIANGDMLTLVSSFLVIIPFLIFSAFFCILVPLFLSFIAPKYFLMAGSTAYLFTLLNMASLSSAHNWTGEGNLTLQLLAFAAIFSLLLFSRVLPRKLVSIIIVLVFAVNTGMALMGGTDTDRAEESVAKGTHDMGDNPFESWITEKKMKKTHDIFFLVFESYAPFETILEYGYDNSSQIEYLKEMGFKNYQGIYSLAAPTTASMTYTFNLDSSFPVGKGEVSGRNIVKDVLNSNGYLTTYMSVSDYMFRGLDFSQISWDSTYPVLSRNGLFNSGPLLIGKAILKGEFSDLVSLEGEGVVKYLEEKNSFLSYASSSPRFLYSHSQIPGHGPSSGILFSEKQKYIVRYLEKLQEANREMEKDVEVLLERNPEAIIIIAGDHGPFLTRMKNSSVADKQTGDDINRHDIQDRFGTFLAIRWPESEYAEKYDIRILQDVFPAVFAYLYDDESIFERLRMKRSLISTNRILGVTVLDGIIVGGQDNGEPLFLNTEEWD